MTLLYMKLVRDPGSVFREPDYYAHDRDKYYEFRDR